MFDNFSVDVNTTQYESAMYRLEQGVKRGYFDSAVGTLPVQARLLAERCQELTPPKNVGQGRAAVSRDITGIFTPVSQRTWSDKGIRKIIRNDDRPAWDAFAHNLGKNNRLKDSKAISFSEELHKRLRTKRGFVNKGDRRGYVTLGGEGQKVRKYIQAKRKLVGWAKSGWNAAIIRLGGVVRGSWISTKGVQGGSIAINNDSIRVTNSTSWAGKKQREAQRIVQYAIASRAVAMERYFERMMNLAAKNATKS